MFALSVLAALGHLSQRERQGTGDADSHASDIGHWLGMTGQKQGAGAVDVRRGGRLCPVRLSLRHGEAVAPPSRRVVGADSHARVADWLGMTG